MNFGPDFGVNLFQPAAVLKVTGEDALSFLQGQFTQDLRREIGTVAYGLWLNQKGKVVADSFVLRDLLDIWVVSLFCEAAVIFDRLQAYIIADDVTIEDVTEEWSGAVFIGNGSGAWLSSVQAYALPSLNGFARPLGGLLFRGRRSRRESWEWLFPRTQLAEMEAQVASMQRLDGNHVELERIRAGCPAVPVDLGPKDLPNEGGLEKVAVSYSKGCYLGQEVMARLKAMGQVRRQLIQVRGEGRPPSKLPLELMAGDKKVGELRSTAIEGDHFLGLAMVSLLNLGSAESLRFAGEEVGWLKVARIES